MFNDNIDDEVAISIDKPSRATRWKRSITARMRRASAKYAIAARLRKEEKDAIQRLEAKERLMEAKYNT